MKKLRAYSEPMIQLNDEEWRESTKFYTLHTFQKGESIRTAGEVCNQAYYLSKGAVRSYMITDEGKEKTLMVHVNKKDAFLDPFFGDFISYITQTEGEFFCEALEPCEVYITDYKNIENLYNSDIRWMRVGKLLAEEQLVKLVERKKWSTLDATKRYEYIQKNKPLYEELLPDYQLASLLNITPQSLSRIKNSF
jgi:CRP-like cAMP-binding protein